jgi:hypothetical protein
MAFFLLCIFGRSYEFAKNNQRIVESIHPRKLPSLTNHLSVRSKAFQKL